MGRRGRAGHWGGERGVSPSRVRRRLCLGSRRFRMACSGGSGGGGAAAAAATALRYGFGFRRGWPAGCCWLQDASQRPTAALARATLLPARLIGCPHSRA
jgi:hypothetical protein